MRPREFLRRLRARAAAAAKAVLLPIGLFLTYFIVVGLTRLLARLLRPDFLLVRREGDGSLWRRAEGCEADESDARSQS